ncbi:MAG: hypothetical protein QMB39_05760, partial [Bacteroidales bacterium]
HLTTDQKVTGLNPVGVTKPRVSKKQFLNTLGFFITDNPTHKSVIKTLWQNNCSTMIVVYKN